MYSWPCRDSRIGNSGAVLANAEDGSWSHGQEDSDAAASTEISIPDCKKPTCMHVDETAGICVVRAWQIMHHGSLPTKSLAKHLDCLDPRHSLLLPRCHNMHSTFHLTDVGACSERPVLLPNCCTWEAKVMHSSILFAFLPSHIKQAS